MARSKPGDGDGRVRGRVSGRVKSVIVAQLYLYGVKEESGPYRPQQKHRAARVTLYKRAASAAPDKNIMTEDVQYISFLEGVLEDVLTSFINAVDVNNLQAEISDGKYQKETDEPLIDTY